jgi:hypothetical protein
VDVGRHRPYVGLSSSDRGSVRGTAHEGAGVTYPYLVLFKKRTK